MKPRAPVGRALVVDDSAVIRAQLSAMLRRVGIHTVEAEDGAAAWRFLQGASADVILTDINMPVVDGLKLISLVRGSGANQHTPIVVITTESGEADRRRAADLGATAYLTKPPREAELVALVLSLLAGVTTA